MDISEKYIYDCARRPQKGVIDVDTFTRYMYDRVRSYKGITYGSIVNTFVGRMIDRLLVRGMCSAGGINQLISR